MKLTEAKRIIKAARASGRITTPKAEGFRVHFEIRGGGVLAANYFPDKGEKLLKDKEQAWKLAREFASATDENHGNVYVVDHQFRPVADYKARKLKAFY